MTFNSWEFLIFYPIIALLYFLLPKQAKMPLLLIASYYFYAFYQAELLFLIVLTTLVSWVASNFISRTDNTTVRKVWLVITLVVCLGVLFFYKYFNFLSASFLSVAGLLGVEAPALVLDLILPVGISFYTFQTLSYVIDVYRGKIETEKNFFYYASFVSFFPQLVAGPIERPDNLLPQLKSPKSFNKEDAIKGAKHMLVGFFKKICVADIIAVYVNSVYNNPTEANAPAIIIATVLFAVQIYCDFSGYTDIAIGCARIMGIKLMQNFDHPYTSTSIKEFWQRWHISLSSWFRDYLYIPLGGNRCSKPRRLFNVFVVFLVSGLWHGANWTYVIWGALHGIYQIVGSLTRKGRDALLQKIGLAPDCPIVKAMRQAITFVLVAFAWLFFRANTPSDALILLGKLVTDWSSIGQTLEIMNLNPIAILISIFSIATLVIIDKMLTYDEGEDGSAMLVTRGSFIYFIWIVLLCWALLLSKNIESSFIYFQF